MYIFLRQPCVFVFLCNKGAVPLTKRSSHVVTCDSQNMLSMSLLSIDNLLCIVIYT